MDVKEILSFLERDELHQPISNYYYNGNQKYGAGIGEPPEQKTIYEVAVELEERYQVIQEFINKYKDDITLFIAKEKFHAGMHPEDAESSDFAIAEHIKGLWLDFMEKGEHGVITGRAIATNMVGLIDTGQYYQSMEIDYNGTNSNAGF